MCGFGRALYVVATAMVERLKYLGAPQMVAQCAHIIIITVEQHASVRAYDGDAKPLHLMSCHVIMEAFGIEKAVFAQRLHHFIVEHLQPRVHYINLVFLLSLVLIYAEAYGEEQEHAAHARHEVLLERLNSQSSSHSLHGF